MSCTILESKVAVVTGASRGIGKSIAEALARNGAIVYANVREENTTLQKWLSEINESAPGEVRLSHFDITDQRESKDKITAIWREHKKIDVLINNAGIEYNENIGMISSSHIQKMFQINVIALIEIAQLVGRIMMKCQSGSIVNIASIVGRYGAPGQSVYSATKGAVISFSRSAAKELGPYNVRVNAIAPGITQTDMVVGLKKEFLDRRIAQIPLGRIATPQDIAEACVFLASDNSSYISGQVLGIDGGCTL